MKPRSGQTRRPCLTGSGSTWDSGARAELLEQLAYYDQQRPGFGRKLLKSVRAVVLNINEFPSIGRPWGVKIAGEEIRGLAVPGFPLTVYYVVLGGALVVLAVAHTRRASGYWVSRADRWSR